MHIAASSVENFSEGGLFTKDETLQKEVFSPPISTQCDIFSFGVLCLRLLIGEDDSYDASQLLSVSEARGREMGTWESRLVNIEITSSRQTQGTLIGYCNWV